MKMISNGNYTCRKEMVIDIDISYRKRAGTSTIYNYDAYLFKQIIPSNSKPTYRVTPIIKKVI